MEAINKAIKDTREWSQAQNLSPSKVPRCFHPQPTDITNPSSLLCFTDGAWDAKSKYGGMGWIFKDLEGSTLAQGSDARSFVSSALMAEALALKSAISSAIHLGFLNLRCLSDSRSLISLFTTDSSVIYFQGTFHVIRALSSSLLSISFVFTPRLANVCADGLAKTALLLFVSSPHAVE